MSGKGKGTGQTTAAAQMAATVSKAVQRGVADAMSKQQPGKPAAKQSKKKSKPTRNKPLAKSEARSGYVRAQPLERSARSIMSPLSKVPIPSPMRMGTAHPQWVTTRMSITLAPTERFVGIITNTGVCAGFCAWWKLTASQGIANGVMNFPRLALADDAGGPTSGRAMKCGATLVNSTQDVNRGGRVFHYDAQARLNMTLPPGTTTSVALNAFIDGVLANEEVVDYNATEFATPKELTCSVADAVKYLDFGPWQGSQDLNGFLASSCVWPGYVPDHRPMSTIVIILDYPPVTQTYSLTGRSAYYTRWPIDTTIGQAMVEVPVAPQHVVNRIHAAGERLASAVHTAETMGLGAMAARAFPYVRAGISRALSRAGPAVLEGLEMAAVL